jgi:predicted lipoprotein with Yx(FWY)xxD motif
MRTRTTALLIAGALSGVTAAIATAAPAHHAAPRAGAQAPARSDGGGWGASSTSPAGSASAAGVTVKLAHSSAGAILVNAKGRTLYLFTADGKNSDHCIKSSACIAAWPPLTVSGKPTAGAGVKASLLGTISIGGGRKQVTYAGHPLYLFTEDSGPASTGYFGASSFGGTWYGVSATGSAVT